MDSMGLLHMKYNPPLALEIISIIFLALGLTCGLIVLLDITIRKGWRSMMWIMIPTYPITAMYMGPIGMYLYFKYGRAANPKDAAATGGHSHHAGHQSEEKKVEEAGDHEHQQQHYMQQHLETAHEGHEQGPVASHAPGEHTSPTQKPQKHEMSGHDTHMHEMGGPARPIWATIMIGVSHCGAGCVLGDVVGEFIVYGSGTTINGVDTWPCLLIDFAFALFFGIIFQYFSIGPMSGDYGFKTLVRAAKADFLSLAFFEIGLFGWMVAYQVGIFGYQLDMISWTYWWLMQVGMFFGYWTALPINWWLITRNIKEPCA